jgi:hypothetical protein
VIREEEARRGPGRVLEPFERRTDTGGRETHARPQAPDAIREVRARGDEPADDAREPEHDRRDDDGRQREAGRAA